MEKRNTILLAVIAIVTLFVAAIGATFAYFASEIKNNGTLNVNVATSNNQATFVATTDGDINFTVDAFEMQQADVSNENQSTNENYAKGLRDNATLNVTLLASDNGKETTCTYDIIYTWTGGESNFASGTASETGKSYYPSNYYVRSDSSMSTGFKEFTIEGDLSVGVVDQEAESPQTLEGINETNIDEFAPKDGDTSKKVLVLKKGQTITSVSTTNASYHKYDFTVRFYNLNKDQSSLMNKTFAGTISVDNVHC